MKCQDWCKTTYDRIISVTNLISKVLTNLIIIIINQSHQSYLILSDCLIQIFRDQIRIRCTLYFLLCCKLCCFWRNLHRWQKFYTAAVSGGSDKSHLCILWLTPISMLINLIRKSLTNLIGALRSMAATSRSKNQAVAQLWFHVVNVWVYMVRISIWFLKVNFGHHLGN